MAINKCQPKKKVFCDSVRSIERKDGHYGRGAGIYVANTMNMKTMEENKRLAIQISGKMGEYTYLPFCPMCGVKLL